MRWHWKRYKPGDVRTREFFAWLPVTVRNERGAETRWLERVKVLEMFQEFKSLRDSWTSDRTPKMNGCEHRSMTP